MTDTATTASLDGPRALDVLTQLHDQLGPTDADTRALVALTVAEDGTVALTDVALRDDGVLETPDDVAGIVVVTSEDVRLDDEDGDDGEDVVLHHLVAILADGTEVGVVRVGDDDTPRVWSSADGADGMRPRDLTANTARRALGLPSLADVPPIEDLLARAWLVRVASAGLEAFDGPAGPREVEPEELDEYVDVDPLGECCAQATAGYDPSTPPSWAEVREAAIAGQLHVGSLTVDAAHARWLDVDGFAQVVDRTLPSTEELLGTLRIVGEDPLVGWAIEHITARGWGRR